MVDQCCAGFMPESQRCFNTRKPDCRLKKVQSPLKAERCFIGWHVEDSEPGSSISVALRNLLQGGGRGHQALYKFATKGAGGLKSKDQISGKELSILRRGGCKPLGSLNSLLSYAPRLSGVKLISLFTLRRDRCLILVSSQTSALTVGGGNTFWITASGALVDVWRPDLAADGFDISRLLIRPETFSFDNIHGGKEENHRTISKKKSNLFFTSFLIKQKQGE